MPKKGRGRGCPRGGSRGGRGGRGGFIGRNSKAQKRRRQQQHTGGQPNNGEFPELFDLNNPDFISVSHPERSMRAAAARGSRKKFRLQDEVFNTQDNVESTMKLPLRKRPVEFVKSTTLDPSKDLIRKLKEKDQYIEKVSDNKVTFVSEGANPNGSEEQTLPNEEVIQVDDGNYSQADENMNDHAIVPDDHHKENEVPAQLSVIINEKPKEPKNTIQQVPDGSLFFKDDDGDKSIIKNIKEVSVPAFVPQAEKSSNNTEYTPSISIGHTLLSTKFKDTSNDSYVDLPKTKKDKDEDFEIDLDQSIYEIAGDGEDYHAVNTPTTQELYRSYNKYISRVMQNLADAEEDEDHEDDEDYDEDEMFGNKRNEEQDLFAELDDDFEEEANFIANIEDEDDVENSEEKESFNGHHENAVEQLNKLNIKESSEAPGYEVSTSEDPEFGFLPEDYETFDHSLVDVINVRFGAGTNQYHIKSFRLTGSYDFLWIDQDLFEDFLVGNGMPEHRINAYFKFVQAQLEPEGLNEEDFDFPIDDSSSEEQEEEIDDHDDYDNEGLDDLIKFTSKYDGVRDLEYETKTLTTRGKGRKKELDLDHVADMDLRQSLADQYQAQRRNKKERRKERESNIAKEHSASKDLSLKYPYTIYVNDFKNEFEEFLQDSKRNALTFPPLDPHGNKVVMKFAFLYNMKSRKFGAGKQQHVVAVKNKRTFHSIPDYHSVSMLCKQRPVFNRIDQKRPRVEIEAEEAKSSRRGKPSKAHVKEGDIVGENAPEISTSNIGRRLLEKLGWKAGQGLGAENRGIPEPVIAKVKKTKLGLR